MSKVALMRVAALRPVGRFLRRIGASTDRALDRARLPRIVFDDPEALVPAYLGTAFVAEAARLVGIEHFGATVAEHTTLADLGTFGRRLLQEPTLADLLATARRIHSGHHSGETYWLDDVGDRVLLCQRFTLQLDDWLLQSTQYSIFVALGLVLSVAGRGVRPRVHLRCGIPRAIARTRWMERAECVFDQPRCAIEMPPSLLHVPLPTRPPAPAAAEIAEWYRTRPADELVPSLRQWVGGTLGTEAARIDVLAATIGTTARTLQRRLAEVGTTYAHVLADARFHVAADLLARDAVAIRDVAHHVGYRDPAHLTRAFRRWSGMTPSAYRRMRRHEGTPPMAWPTIVAGGASGHAPF